MAVAAVRDMHALAPFLQRIASAPFDLFESLRFATGMTIVGGVFVMVQTLLLAEHLITLGGRIPWSDRAACGMERAS
jgi:hypothetical protein